MTVTDKPGGERVEANLDDRVAGESFRRLLGLAREMVCLIDAKGRFELASRSWGDFLGVPAEKLRGQACSDFIHPDDRAATLNLGRQLPADVINFVNRYRSKDGSYRWLSWNACRLSEWGMLGTALDVTDRMFDGQTALLLSELLEGTLDIAELGLLLVDTSGKVKRFNQRYVEMWGLDGTLMPSLDHGALVIYLLKMLKHPETYLSKTLALYGPIEGTRVEEFEMVDGRRLERSCRAVNVGDSAGRLILFRVTPPRPRPHTS